jgi:hypothetical protein
VLMDQQQEELDLYLANEIRVHKINATLCKQIPDYEFFTRFSALSFILAMAFGVAFWMTMFYYLYQWSLRP